ncbi:hypothetical protein [uncultured Psychroserpens sp.]|uniref:hypothetical protein n=1 Tax=uncultured Psychroserpens sp. TaxID=255436 RepID=UPI00260F9595|nr:hypothetical protein [uncultured Psychroserpens sp.]
MTVQFKTKSTLWIAFLLITIGAIDAQNKTVVEVQEAPATKEKTKKKLHKYLGDKKKNDQKTIEVIEIDVNSNKKTSTDSEVIYTKPNSNSNTTSSSSFSYSSANGKPNIGKYSVAEYFDKKKNKQREILETRLIQMAIEAGYITDQDSIADFKITQDSVLINGKIIVGEFAESIQTEIKETIDHGEQYNFNFSRTIFFKN